MLTELFAAHARGAESFDARRLTLWQAWAAKLPRNAFVERQLEAPTAR
jgi:hypothetical protein